MIRVVAMLALFLAACGDDTSAPSPDLATTCFSQCCDGNHCAPPGATCSVLESACTCADDGTWHCHPIVQHDLAVPIFHD